MTHWLLSQTNAATSRCWPSERKASYCPSNKFVIHIVTRKLMGILQSNKSYSGEKYKTPENNSEGLGTFRPVFGTQALTPHEPTAHTTLLIFFIAVHVAACRLCVKPQLQCRHKMIQSSSSTNFRQIRSPSVRYMFNMGMDENALEFVILSRSYTLPTLHIFAVLVHCLQ